MTNAKRSLATSALVGGALMASLVLAEVAVRVASASNARLGRHMREQDPFATLIQPLGRQGHRQRPHAVFRYRNGTQATANGAGYRGPEVPTERSDGTLRVLLLGGSTTHGWGVDDSATIDAHMRRLFEARGQRVEVINLAFDGYDAFQDLQRYEAEGRAFRPDVVIVNSGINDVRNARIPDLSYADPRTMLWSGELARQREELALGGPRARTYVKHWSYLYRLGSFVRLSGRRKAEQQQTVALIPNPEAVDHFETSIARIIAIAAEDSAVVLLSSPPSSIRELYQPDATSYHTYWLNDAATTQAWRDSLDLRMRRLATAPPVPGARVGYVAHRLSGNDFIDDCHLTPVGNAALATEFVSAIDSAWPALARMRPKQDGIQHASAQHAN